MAQHGITSTHDASLVLECTNVTKYFGVRDSITRALNGITLSVKKGEFLSIMGPSGSGKSTLLNCISTIDSATSGSIFINGKPIEQLKGKALAKFRHDELGFIFQDSNLIETLNAYENIALPLMIAHVPSSTIRLPTK